MRYVSVVFALLAAAGVCHAEPDKTKLSAIHEKMEKYVADQHVCGVVTVVGTSKGVVSLDAAGKLSLDGPAMPKDAVFRIASMTKPMTAVAVLILADEGKLKVDDPVEKHLPEFKGQWLVEKSEKDRLSLKKPSRPITLRDLLTHTSGLPGYPSGLGNVYQKRDRSLAEAVLAVSQSPLQFEPGSRWAYCNTGIDTLGRVVEVVSGESYEDFMKKRIFDPLGMKDTTFRPTKEQLKREAGLYDRKNGKLVAPADRLLGPTEKSRHPIPAGGAYSTGADVARFYRMMLNEGTLDGKKILKPETVKEMTKVQTGELKTGFTAGMGFGLGFAVVRKPEGVTKDLSEGSFGHGGAFGTQSWADPKRDLFTILLIQRVGLNNSDASEFRQELQRLAVEAMGR
jgi:CubicO group peptidase (beta-lactamase class C family)